MTDAEPTPPGSTAGSLLRAARERQGLHIAALAASIKVTPRKLDALENDRYDELPDASFTRALAQTVCRSLRIDARPVLALLPQADASALDHVAGTLNTPFRERPGREAPGGLAVAAIRPLVWAGAALLLAAVLVYFLPSSLWQPTAGTAAPPVADAAPTVPSTPAAAVATAASTAASTLASTAASAVPTQTAAASPTAAAQPVSATASAPPAPAPAPAPAVAVMALAAASAAPSAAGLPGTPAGGGVLQLQADEASWIEVRDARGQVLLSRLLQPAESVGLDGALPIKLTIGNARGTRLRFRGKPVDLAAATRDNVARLELQ